MGDSIGTLTERLTLQRSDPEVLAISSLTRVGTTATAITTKAHGYATKDYVTVAGASPAGYNGRVKITVLDATSFSYAVDGALASPATQGITVTYYSDAQGGRLTTWRTIATVWAEMVPLRTSERLQLAAIQSDVEYRFRVRARVDLSPKQRAVWTPRFPPGAPATTLEISGVLPCEDGRTYLFLDCAQAPN